MDAAGLLRHTPRPADAAKLLGDRQPCLQPVLVEASAEMRAAEPGVVHALQRPELFLRADGGGVEQGMIVLGLVEHAVGARHGARVEREKELFARVDALQLVHPIGDDAAAVWIVAYIVPTRP